MHLHSITLLLTIAIFATLHYHNEVSAKKTVLYKKHSNHNKKHIQHHEQQSSPSKHYKLQHQKQHQLKLKHSKKSHKNTKPHKDKHRYKQHSKQHYLNKKPHHAHKNKHLGHRNLKVAHRQAHIPMHPLLRAVSSYCPEGQHPRIIGGNIAAEGHFQHAATIYSCWKKPPESIKDCYPSCGGSIISERHIITAAHCLIHNNTYEFAYTFLIRVGVQDLRKPEVAGTIFRVKTYSHNGYFNESTGFFDVVIIKLNSSITFNHHIKPVCINGLHLNYYLQNNNNNKNVIMAGWGRKSRNGALTSDVLKYAKLHIYDMLNCFGNKSDIYEGAIVFCVNSTSDNDGFGCHGDSGSGLLPLTHDQEYVNVLVGVYRGSAGNCYNPMTYANVTTLARWINDTVEFLEKNGNN